MSWSPRSRIYLSSYAEFLTREFKENPVKFFVSEPIMLNACQLGDYKWRRTPFIGGEVCRPLRAELNAGGEIAITLGVDNTLNQVLLTLDEAFRYLEAFSSWVEARHERLDELVMQETRAEGERLEGEAHHKALIEVRSKNNPVFGTW